jgi:hypothetical protein
VGVCLYKTVLPLYPERYCGVSQYHDFPNQTVHILLSLRLQSREDEKHHLHPKSNRLLYNLTISHDRISPSHTYPFTYRINISHSTANHASNDTTHITLSYSTVLPGLSAVVTSSFGIPKWQQTLFFRLAASRLIIHSLISVGSDRV